MEKSATLCGLPDKLTENLCGKILRQNGASKKAKINRNIFFRWGELHEKNTMQRKQLHMLIHHFDYFKV